jgi:hypothetical protein
MVNSKGSGGVSRCLYGRFSTLVKRGVYPVSKVPGFEGMRRVSRSRLDQMMRENEESGGE